MNHRLFRLWLRWVLANALAEFIGLGTTFALGIGLFAGLTYGESLLAHLTSMLIMTLSGALEGFVVGLLQWWAMHLAFPGIKRRAWIQATTFGALIAWFLGTIPMTLASLSAPATEQPVQEPQGMVMLLLTMGMGLAAGLVLSVVQWRVLRGTVSRAWVWLPANSLAWAAGMPLIFTAVDLALEAQANWQAVTLMGLALLMTGALVGAVHGVALLWLAKHTWPTGGGRS